ncbi:YheU family protein [Myxococcota bacterium]|nr:YheU family protein [Myxococcota bacterium]
MSPASERDDEHGGDGGGEAAGVGRVVVPWERLSPEALRGVIEEFVTREGTEYGPSDVALDEKVRVVRRQLERREVFVVFDGAAGSVNLVTADALGDL